MQGEPSVSTSSDAVKRALDLLTQAWPMTIGRNELVACVETSLDAGSAPRTLVEAAIDELLEFLILRGIARIRLAPVLASADVSVSHPCVDPLVRRMTAALEGADSYVANAWHESIELSPVERALYPSMDGSLDREGLIRLLVDQQNLTSASGSGKGEASTDVDRMLARLSDQAVLLP